MFSSASHAQVSIKERDPLISAAHKTNRIHFGPVTCGNTRRDTAETHGWLPVGRYVKALLSGIRKWFYWDLNGQQMIINDHYF